MKRKRKAGIIWIALSLALCFAGCGRQAAKAPSLANASYTLLIYMCGGSLETKNGAASADLSELLSAHTGENINIVIETGGASAWKQHGISSDRKQRYAVSGGALRRVYEAASANMGEAETLADFLAWGAKAFPAEKTSLILWGHGSAEGVCADELFGGDALTPAEINGALRVSGIEKLDFIGFDACYSASIDNARAVADYAGSMIASQMSVPTSGWDYAALAEALAQGGVARAILQGYAAANADKRAFALSAIDLSRVSEIEAVFHKLLESARKSGANILAEDGEPLVADAGNMRLYDLGGAAARRGVSAALTGIVSVVASAAFANASGISFCAPAGDGAPLKSYIAASTDDVYCEYLTDYFYEKTDDGGVVFADKGRSDGQTLTFALSKGSLPYIESVTAEVFLTDQSGEETSLGGMSVSGREGKFTIPLSGRWASIGGCPIHTDIVSEKNGVTLLSSPAEVNGKSSRLFLLHNDSSQALVLSGYEAENGAVLPLKNGDALAIGGQWLSEYAAELSPLPDGRYRYAGRVTDKNGSTLATRSAVIDIRGGMISLVLVSE